ncbi:acetylglutamate kinase [Helicobacter sp. 11S02629-2]|uniref:acetylglutamate kinase n=1 Tax=Helicobacter sp. 11S02629-2 TaxID=1476195 RepID=UPI000BA4ECB8|nr:acetylglutamate kinase [Helicobacter sp. 11S02629-2]PAF46067.1 acetylglutamate kinase [Helicobacter sp. 11S02629-2]
MKDSVIVIKYGGSAFINEKNSVIDDIVALHKSGAKVVLVHGGGKDISKALVKEGIESRFVEGLRVSDKQSMEVIDLVLSGKINKNLSFLLSLQGVNALGLSSKDSLLLKASPLDLAKLGFVGKLESVNASLLHTLLDSKLLPVISPIGVDIKGEIYNINADHVALGVASSLKASKLVFLSDIDGVLQDKDDKTSRFNKLSQEKALSLIESGVISGGMIPKVRCALEGVESGVKEVVILNANTPNVLKSFLLEGKELGTRFLKA